MLSSFSSRATRFLARNHSTSRCVTATSSLWSNSPSLLSYEGNNLFESHTCSVNTNDDIQNQRRYKHSERQINRLFRKHPARARVDARLGIEREKSLPEEETKPKYDPVYEATVLPNGWSKPPPEDFERPQYPFQIARTKNKPNNAVGFLPVYAKFRKDGTKAVTRIKKVTGDREDFLRELRVVLQLPNPKNPKEDPVRIRTGGTIEVSGNHVRTVRTWLAGLGF